MNVLSPSPELTLDEVEKGLSHIIFDGLFTHAFVTLTSGIFLIAFALELGASNIIIGLLAAVPPFAELVQIPAVGFIERIRNRRLITVAASLLSRSLWILIALVPFLFSPGAGIYCLVLLLVTYACISSVKHCSWKSWMRDLIPDEILGMFFSRRMALSFALATVLSLCASFFLDLWKSDSGRAPVFGYSLIFLVGSLIGLSGTYFLISTPEPRMTVTRAVSLKSRLSVWFADANFRNLIIFLCLWSFAVNLAAPFVTVYLLKRLSLDITVVILLSIVSQVCSIVLLPFWGSIADRFSNKSVLKVAGPLFLICFIALTFTNLPDPHALTMPLLVIIHIVMGVSMAGVTLAAGNIGLKLAPKGSATSYLAGISIFTALTAGIAPIIGGFFVDHLADCELAWNLVWKSPGVQFTIPTLYLVHWDYFFVFAFLIGLYSLHRLSYVKEQGEVDEPIFIPSLIAYGKDMRNFSTAGGIRNLLRFPVNGIDIQSENASRKRRKGPAARDVVDETGTVHVDR
ncbi:MAG: MFS transporter [Methanoregula sp.]|jgi:MFS family permease